MNEPPLNYIRPTARDQDGQTYVEYALLLFVLVAGLLFVFQPLGVSLQGFVNVITDSF